MNCAKSTATRLFITANPHDISHLEVEKAYPRIGMRGESHEDTRPQKRAEIFIRAFG